MTAAKTRITLDDQIQREPLTEIAYGPIESRRFGITLGVNLFGAKKYCSFDCPYCDLGRTQLRLNQMKDDTALPKLADVVSHIRTALETIHATGPRLDTILVSGNGEPTLHPEFNEIARELFRLKAEWASDKKLVVLTNGSALDNRRIIESLDRFDERVVKLDAGNEKLFKTFASPLSRTNLTKVISGSRSLKDFTVQSLFCQGLIDNTKTSDVDDWIEVIGMLMPKAVHVHGLSRVPAVSGLIRCDEDTIHSIAYRLERRTGIKAIITP
jgi:wyosine [tRNA(Phe)-imidazoG37] synthetase (radical SAM superfamily)